MTLQEALAKGDFTGCSTQQLSEYLEQLCGALGLSTLTQPFAFLRLNGKLVPYAKKDAADQLRATRGISVAIAARELHQDMGVYVVTAQARDRDGRADEAIGAVNIKGLSGDELANAFMKAETKAKRRVTLSICGLGMSDETEIETIPGAQPIATEVLVNQQATPVASDHALISPKQLSFLATLLKEAGLSAEPGERENNRRFVAYLAGLSELEDVKQLTRAEASRVLDKLTGANVKKLVAEWAARESAYSQEVSGPA